VWTLCPEDSVGTGSSPGPTFDALRTTDVLMLAGGGIAAHPDGPAAGVRSLRDAWTAAVEGVPLHEAASDHARRGDEALLHAVNSFSGSK
jgi:ribulose-bisphosphate carboxylase large chain